MMNFTHLFVIVAIVCQVTANFPEFLKVETKGIGSNDVTLSFTKVERSESQLTFPCDLFYYPTNDGWSNKKKMSLPHFKDHVYVLKITGLIPNTEYTVCTNSNNQVLCTFKTESKLTTTTSSGEVVEYKEKRLFSGSTLDIALGVLFGVVALCIVGVTSIYLYRRHQRRQTIRNFFRTPHTDPFESLQDYVE